MADKTNNEENTVVQAIGKSIKSSPRKANVTLSLIRGLRVDKAINNLVFCRKRISNEILKILKSAISNAENNHQLDIDKLIVKEASVGKSMVLKRFRPRARGRAGKILKPFSRIRILVQEKNEDDKKKLNENKKIKVDDGTKN
ncbi:MAG: 50S ribosomal protein L22 [Alphaproteobacteria bacterium]|tara:strand:+ start:71 stop:499 length:429 start_codon:yes stop_codon:yes gene_type:complete